MRQLKKSSILSILNNYLFDSQLAININYMYNFGSILGIMLIIQIISGIFLTMNYIPNVEHAFNSIEYIMREINYGWLIRYIHSNGAAFFFLGVYFHILRGLLYGSYIGKRKLTWIFGVIIFLLMIITAFVGYSLVYGQMSYRAVTVITNLLTTIPYIGNELVYLIWGSFSVGNSTLNRFYTFHYLLPFIIVAMSICHLISLHEVGGSNPLGLNNWTVTFNPYYSLQDILGFIVIITLLLLFVIFLPNYLNHSDNYIPADPLITPSHIVPELYLLAFYAILRAIPNKTLGVVGMLFSILSYLFLPFIHNHIVNSTFWRPISKWSVYLFVCNFLLLTWIGQALVCWPFTIIGQFLTLFYFLFFVSVPIISFVEFLLFIL